LLTDDRLQHNRPFNTGCPGQGKDRWAALYE
jgi:hypothetical protein